MSVFPARSAITRSTTADTDRHVIRSNSHTTVLVVRAVNHAQVSSKLLDEPSTRPGPRHRSNHDTVLPAGHPRRRSPQEHPGCPEVQRPPATDTPALVITAAPPLAPRTPTTRSPGRVQVDDQHLVLAVALPAEAVDRDVLDAENLPPYP